MPSRKKAKGKARKAAKEAKEAEAEKATEESRALVEAAVNQRQERDESFEMHLQRLTMMINTETPKLCRHGTVPLSTGDQKICLEFINAFTAVFDSVDGVMQALITAKHATKEVYPDVYDSKLDTVISVFLSYGTQCILDEDNSEAKLYASFACYFCYFEKMCLRKTPPITNITKLPELYDADEHTLVSFYRKRIPCSCLDEKYKEVKSVKKMGHCFGPSCSHPGRKAERSKMFSCTRCGEVNYCSVACQKANWKDHKKFCDDNAKLKAAFDSDQS